MAELDPQTEQCLADMSNEDFAALTARVRPPTSTQQLRDIAGKVLEGSALDSFVAVADPKKFAAENGDVDEEKVMGHMTAIFAAGQPQQRRDWGQSSTAGGPPKQPGDNARAALRKRHGVGADTNQPGDSGRVSRGENARAALQRRHGVKGQK
jgi:hypothetical protein